ncbi:Thioredoxin/glutathione peroxidase BtuE [Andreprevotia sp. IGB-42]|uniref:glutathione peroxidase n=1 Tax=Andreprevotia sp. IGB-42 TaxID=2497473 RepID=UPI00135B8C64|nr:glutathione peroxidase [Andreprevotia sp. IGB-42]KAF0815156.1 Thioredoxin/glutathione peroxidase BtuE [Andreprevotia sp. IGB-42]
MSQNIQSIPVKKIDGSPATLQNYQGKVLLVVNVASQCGLTKQYAGLEQLYRDKKAEGFEVLGFPANNFKQQEPGSNEEIASFCSTEYDVTFPLFEKISVSGADQHPLYAALTDAQPNALDTAAFREKLAGKGLAPDNEKDVLWNFEKFLIDRNGKVVGRFSPDIVADDSRLLQAVEAELAKH